MTGIDSSPEMLARAKALEGDRLRFELGPIEKVEGEWDLVFSHAALHWVDDHQSLVPRLLSFLRPRGQLAVQIPSNYDHPSHRLIKEIAREEPFNRALGGWTKQPATLTIAEYAELLYRHGGEEITVFEKIYPHLLESSDALADWTSSTALVPYFERLPEGLQKPFMQRYRARMHSLWPDGPVFYGFKRIIFAATRT